VTEIKIVTKRLHKHSIMDTLLIDKIKLIETRLKNVKGGKWELKIEGEDFTGGDTVIIRENNEDLYLTGADLNDWKLIGNSKSDIEFLLKTVKKLLKI